MTMITSRASSAVGLALLLSLTLSSCTDDETPQTASTPSTTDTDARDGVDDDGRSFERFIGRDASDTYFKLRKQNVEVRFGAALTKPERQNIKGTRTHPDVIIEALELGTRDVVIITDVSCQPRSSGGSGSC